MHPVTHVTCVGFVALENRRSTGRQVVGWTLGTPVSRTMLVQGALSSFWSPMEDEWLRAELTAFREADAYTSLRLPRCPAMACQMTRSRAAPMIAAIHVLQSKNSSIGSPKPIA
jgi:hypothetical protein